jgi:hypothetical protein
MNKYTIGTIVGTALLGFVNKNGNKNKTKVTMGRKIVSSAALAYFLTTEQIESYLELLEENPNLFETIGMNIKKALIDKNSEYDDIIVNIEFEEVDPDELLYIVNIYFQKQEILDPLTSLDRIPIIKGSNENKLERALEGIKLDNFIKFDMSDDECHTDSYIRNVPFVSTKKGDWSLYQHNNRKTKLRKR